MYTTTDSPPMFMRRPPRAGTSRTRLLAHLEPLLRGDLAAPVVVVEGRRKHRLVVMRGIEIQVHRRGRRIEVRGRNGPRANDWLYGHLRLQWPLSGPNWACAWWFAVRATLPWRLRRLGEAMGADALSRWINYTAQRSGLLRSARRELVSALRLDPGLLKRARGLCPGHELGTEHYELVWQYAAASRQRVREAPRLWPLYGVLRTLGVTPQDELGVIRGMLRDRGLSKGGWKALCRHGRALWWPLRHGYEFDHDPLREIIHHANLLARSGRRDLPPRTLTVALGRMRSMHGWGASGAFGVLPVFLAAWRHMDGLENVSAQVAFARGDLARVLTWWLAHATRPRAPKGAAWVWFERQTDAQRICDELGRTPWETFGRCRQIAGFQIMPLATVHAVRSAGLELRNCMAHADERTHQRALFLIRDGNARALAMFSALYPGRCGRLQEIRARFNQPVDGKLLEVAQAYLDGEKADSRCREAMAAVLLAASRHMR